MNDLYTKIAKAIWECRPGNELISWDGLTPSGRNQLISDARHVVDVYQGEATKKPSPYGPGTFGCHEALHMASIMAEDVSNRLCEHPSIAVRSEWLTLAERARDSLLALYEAIEKQHTVVA